MNLRTFYKSAQLLDDLQACVAEHFPVSVEHSTFQFEPAPHSQHEKAYGLERRCAFRGRASEIPDEGGRLQSGIEPTDVA